MRDDVLQALRSIRRQALAMLVAVLSIAAGVGTVSAIAGIVSSVIGGAFAGIERPGEVVWMLWGKDGTDPTGDAIPPADFLTVRKESTSLRSTAAFRPMGGPLLGAGDPQRVDGLAVTGDYFATLGVPAALGRVLGPADEDDAQERAIVLSDGFFRRSLGADPTVLGRVVQLRGEPHRVVGVTPPGFGFPDPDTDVYVPLRMSPEFRAERGSGMLIGLARLAPGKTSAAASTELGQIAARLAAQHPETNRDMTIGATTLPDLMLGPARAVSVILVLGGALVMAVACTNVASLLFASGAARASEMAVRAALGAPRGRLVRQLLVESLVLAAAGGALGLTLAWLSLRGFVATLPSGFAARIPGLSHVSLDGVAVGIGVVATLVAAIGAGLVPALRASRTDLTMLLRDGTRASGVTPGRQRMMGALVGGEIAAAVALSLAACAALSSLDHARTAPLGYEPAGVYSLVLPRETPAGASGPGATDQAFYDAVTRQARELPGVESVAFAASIPLSRGYSEAPFSDARQPTPPLAAMKWSKLQPVGADYFRVMRIPVLEGRAFADGDRADSAPVAVLSRRAARQVFGDESPVGRTILLKGTTPCTVVGLVDDVQDPHNHRMGALYRPFPQVGQLPPQLLVRATGDLGQLERPLRDLVRSADATQPVARAVALSELVHDSLWTRRTVRSLLGILASLAVALSLVGVYGVASRSAAERSGEFSVRAALGASPRDLLTTAVRGPALVTVVGALIGVALLALVRSPLTEALGGVSLPPALGALTALGVVAVSLAACLGPARRAARTSPAEALRG